MTKRVLVLDDDIAVLEAIEIALPYSGYEVKTIGRTYNIFKTLDDLIDTINGGELCKQLKSNPCARHLPAMMISGREPSIELLRSCGFNDYIAKPFNLTELTDGIQRVLTKSESTNLAKLH
ncbi:MAG TPA: response regulator [Pedobacter sp.]|jgi:DNA-binding response OmpR family regulator